MESEVLTMRDKFAARMLAAVISHHGVYDEERGNALNTYDCYEAARIAYTYANAMIEERTRAEGK